MYVPHTRRWTEGTNVYVSGLALALRSAEGVRYNEREGDWSSALCSIEVRTTPGLALSTNSISMSDGQNVTHTNMDRGMCDRAALFAGDGRFGYAVNPAGVRACVPPPPHAAVHALHSPYCSEREPSTPPRSAARNTSTTPRTRVSGRQRLDMLTFLVSDLGGGLRGILDSIVAVVECQNDREEGCIPVRVLFHELPSHNTRLESSLALLDRAFYFFLSECKRVVLSLRTAALPLGRTQAGGTLSIYPCITGPLTADGARRRRRCATRFASVRHEFLENTCPSISSRRIRFSKICAASARASPAGPGPSPPILLPLLGRAPHPHHKRLPLSSADTLRDAIYLDDKPLTTWLYSGKRVQPYTARFLGSVGKGEVRGGGGHLVVHFASLAFSTLQPAARCVSARDAKTR
jgi:hypothetical protein